MALSAESALREATHNAVAHRGSTIVLTLVALAMTAVSLLTAGRAASAEADVARSVDEAGPRLITLTIEEPSAGLDHYAMARIGQIEGVEWVLGLGAAQDVRSAHTGRRTGIASRTLLSPLPPQVTVTHGRSTRPGEALISERTQRSLGLLEPVGAVTRNYQVHPLVGRFTSSGVIADLDRLVLIHPREASHEHATLVHLLAERALDVQAITDQARILAGIPEDLLTAHTSPELVELGRVLSGQVGALSRQFATGAIAVGLVLVSLTMTLSVGTRRRDYGRRRALGATRSALLALAVLEATISIVAGVLLGTALALGFGTWWNGTIPPATFITANATLIVAAGAAAAIPPAAHAAWLDPLTILRVP